MSDYLKKAIELTTTTLRYIMGKIEGIESYAWMKDGVYYVGTCGNTLKSATAEL